MIQHIAAGCRTLFPFTFFEQPSPVSKRTKVYSCQKATKPNWSMEHRCPHSQKIRASASPDLSLPFAIPGLSKSVYEFCSIVNVFLQIFIEHAFFKQHKLRKSFQRSERYNSDLKNTAKPIRWFGNKNNMVTGGVQERNSINRKLFYLQPAYKFCSNEGLYSGV